MAANANKGTPTLAVGTTGRNPNVKNQQSARGYLRIREWQRRNYRAIGKLSVSIA
ncbi:hypothetical protein COLO4_32082 [Corchorus olitorius]|uniref:Uncharacterized protein n=1 Tax=Corchorus olitorius TaxID=93759 RepID=A0A1R3H1R1_9ROSI|nr:hypothetical protein COLO4_32082 [Corchorus olitorius]